MDLVVEGKALLDSGLTDCCIGISKGKIVRIAKNIAGADRRMNFSNKLILPAGIDLHVHFRDPGMTGKEDFETGSMAAAAGGTTFALDMPNTRPATATIRELQEKRDMASRKSFVDFGLAALLNEKTNIEKLATRASAFKLYLGETTGVMGASASLLSNLLREAAGTAIPVLIHAEHLKLLDDFEERGLEDHDKRRSESLESEAARAVCASGSPGRKMQLMHVTQAGIIAMARENNVLSEVTPHHLLLDRGMNLESRGKINPPLRSKTTRIELWEAFASGMADTVGSDHSPHTIAEKEDDFDAAPSGMPGVETRLPLLLKKVADRKLDISLLARCCSTRPAELLGLEKGRIAEGYDADLIAVELRRPVKIRAERLHSKCGWTPYEGMEAVFPHSVLLRGELLAREGEICGERNGEFVRAAGDDGP